MEPSKKRNVFGESQNKEEMRFELSHDICVVVAVFQQRVYVHIRRYKDRYPTKDGVAMSPEEWEKIIEQLTEESDRKIVTTIGKVMMKRNKNGSATFTSTNKGTSVSLTTMNVDDIKQR